MKPIFPLTVTEPGRADAILAAALEGLTRSAAQRWLEEGRVTLRGVPVKKNARLSPGDELLIAPPQPREVELVPQDIPLDVVYEDGDVIVVNKPVGMVVHPAPGHPDGTLVNALLYHCKNSLSGINGELRPGIVHRIDRDTSGLLIAAKNDRAHLALASQLEDHSLFRLYHAVVLGGFREDSGTVSAPIDRHPVDRKRMAVCRPGQGREAVTHWQLVDGHDGYSHITCRLETGRTHQIRVHMAHMGHPLLGDTVYGGKKPYPGLAGQCLHAAQLTFTHPTTGERMTVEAPLPDWFTAVLKKLDLA
ncbi:MAG: RluA family pseudouridine synthase [Oscillospiraceae bacterium]|nr:RluA family pseudouridine synthase [Oscillospiraceae bacterium]